MGLIEASLPEAVWRQKTSSSFTPHRGHPEKKKESGKRVKQFVFVCVRGRESEIGRRVMSGH